MSVLLALPTAQVAGDVVGLGQLCRRLRDKKRLRVASRCYFGIHAQ
jgi:hypothetical protein